MLPIGCLLAPICLEEWNHCSSLLVQCLLGGRDQPEPESTGPDREPKLGANLLCDICREPPASKNMYK